MPNVITSNAITLGVTTPDVATSIGRAAQISRGAWDLPLSRAFRIATVSPALQAGLPRLILLLLPRRAVPALDRISAALVSLPRRGATSAATRPAAAVCGAAIS